MHPLSYKRLRRPLYPTRSALGFMEPGRDGVVRNNGPPIIGILKYYALARLLLLLRSGELLERARSYRIGITAKRETAALFIACCLLQATRFHFAKEERFVCRQICCREEGRRKMGGGAKRGHIELSTEGGTRRSNISKWRPHKSVCEKSIRV